MHSLNAKQMKAPEMEKCNVMHLFVALANHWQGPRGGNTPSCKAAGFPAQAQRLLEIGGLRNQGTKGQESVEVCKATQQWDCGVLRAGEPVNIPGDWGDILTDLQRGGPHQDGHHPHGRLHVLWR